MFRRLALMLCGLVLAALSTSVAAEPIAASGTVFHDRNADGQRGAGEEGLAGVGVSNGAEVTLTDGQGRWSLPCDDDTTFFVIKPTGWAVPVDANGVPRYYYAHKPNGSPTLKFPGVQPTGPLPGSIDFPLRPTHEPSEFSILVFGDTQTRDKREVLYLADDLLAPLVGSSEFAFGVALGDNAYNDLSVYESLVPTMGKTGLAWRYVLGNHDENYDAASDDYSDETFEATFGPATYAFEVGGVHFIVLDDVLWHPAEGDRKAHYTAALTPNILKFVRNDLAHVSRDKLVVLLMHIPLDEVANRTDLFMLLERRPHTLSFSAHTHTHEQRFLGLDRGWKGSGTHHHVVSGTSCGGWWSGSPDEFGVPHTTMSDGTPNGYQIVTFRGADYEIEYRAAGRDPGFQMALTLVDSDSGSPALYANVFSGSDRSRVRYRIDDGAAWRPMHRAREADPSFLRMVEADSDVAAPYRKLPDPSECTHLWRAELGSGLTRGSHVVRVRAIDMYGHVYEGAKCFWVD